MRENLELELIKNIQYTLSPKDNYRYNSTKDIMNLISLPFHFKLYTLIIILLYLNKKIKKSQILLIISSQFVIFAVKYIVKRKRPFQADSRVKLMEEMCFDPYSFPSGHTLNAFLLCYILKQNINIDLNIIPYIVGLSRVYLGVHYPTDVLGAILLGNIMLRKLS